ncbi:DUF397 domain-containing protein [Streptomyces sp. GZWMJZ-114]|uniref:DUF397 domain-containing protein n=1 Tax=Streptomyces sp. GZWMJZ-114 TaxID=2494734 RepID=UPI0010135E97|nr:DUF397 domain-containing protein [Streptomyces sp. GZWMJZ-114]
MAENGTRASLIPGVIWVKSQASNGTGNCVEVGRLHNGDIAMRNSRDPEGPALVYTRAEVEAFFHGVRGDEFQHLVA